MPAQLQEELSDVDLLDMPSEIAHKPSHVGQFGVNSDLSTSSQASYVSGFSSSERALSPLNSPGSSRASHGSNDLWELEKNLNGKLETLTKDVRSCLLASREHFGTLHEQVRNMSKQISEVQRTMAAAHTPYSSSDVESYRSHGSDTCSSGRDLSQISFALRNGQSPHCSSRRWRGTQQSRATVRPPQAGGICHAAAAAEAPCGQPGTCTRGTDLHAEGPDPSHSSLPVHSRRKRGIETLPCLPSFIELAEDQNAEQGLFPPRPMTLGNLPSLSGEIEEQPAMNIFPAQAANWAPCGLNVEGGRPDVSHSSQPPCRCQKHCIMTSPCLSVFSQLENEQNGDLGRFRARPNSPEETPPLTGEMKRDRKIDHAKVLNRLQRSLEAKASSSSSSRDARWATYQALPLTGLDKLSASRLRRQLDPEERSGWRGARPEPKKRRSDADSFKRRGHDATTSSPLQGPKPQIFGLRGVLPGDMQESRGRETRSLEELFFVDMVEQHHGKLGVHDLGGNCCECLTSLSPGSLIVCLQAKFQGTGNAVAVLLTCLSGQDSSTPRCCIHKTVVVILAAVSPLATCILSRYSFSPECMSPTRSGFALGFGALVSVLVWAFSRRSQRRNCQKSIVQALRRAGLEYDFEAASRWDAFCAVVYWILVVALKLSLLALEIRRCAPDTHLEEAVSTAGFMISAGLLLSVIFAFTQILRMLDLVVKDFPRWVVACDDLPAAVKQWRLCLATIRGTCWAYEYQSSTIFFVLGIIGAFVLIDLSDKPSTRALPEAMIACSILFITWRAISVTQACRRITGILGTASFCMELPEDMTCMLMVYIDQSKAGFYVAGARFTPKLVFKVINAAAVITFAIMSRFSPLLQLS